MTAPARPSSMSSMSSNTPTHATTEAVTEVLGTPEAVLLNVFLHMRSLASRPSQTREDLARVRLTADLLHTVAHELTTPDGLARALLSIQSSGGDPSIVSDVIDLLRGRIAGRA